MNAPFYAKLDRRDLNRDHGLNSVLLDAAGRACASASLALAASDEQELAYAAVDLAAWDQSESSRLTIAFSALGTPLQDAPLLPIVPHRDRKRGTIAETYVWPGEDFRILTSETIAAAGDVDILDLAIGASRVERVQELHRIVMGRGMAPDASKLPEWAEAVALGPLAKKHKISPWRRFYDDLPGAFGDDGEELTGKRILLDEDWNVQPAGLAEDVDQPSAPTVFFQPRERAEDFVDADAAGDIRIPQTLRRWIVFVHDELNWLERAGKTRRRTAARSFLEDNNLVQPYLARTLLERLKGIATKTKSKKVFSDALRLAYKLQRTRAEDERPALRDLGLRVPTQDGWKPAGQAIFGGTWPHTLGTSLERLIGLAAGASSELEELLGRLLVSPEDWPFPIDGAQWTDFLRKLGVVDGLAAVRSSRRARAPSYEFTPDRVGLLTEIPTGARAEWASAVETDGGKPSLSRGVYGNRSAFRWLPGQADYEGLPERARLEYAALVIASADRWSDLDLRADIRRTDVTSHNFDPFTWPTPLAAFFTRVQWMPQPSPQAREEVSWASPSEAWHFSERYTDEGTDYARPDYARLLPPGLRRLIDQRPQALIRLREAGLNVWNDPSDAGRLVEHLAALVAEEVVSETYVANLRKTYEQAWENIIEHELEIDSASPALIVSRKGELEAVHWSRDQPREPIFVKDGGSRLADSVLQLSARPILDVGARVGVKIADRLSETFGESIVRTSELDVVILADGKPVTPDTSSRRLLDVDLVWLERLVIAVLELKRAAFRRVTEVVRDRILETLRSARVIFAAELELKIGDEALPPPYAMRDALPLHDDHYPTLVLRAPGPSITWRELDAAIPAICDLISHPELTDSMRLAIGRLAGNDPHDPPASPGLTALAAALDEPEDEVAAAVRGLRGSVEIVIERLAPVVAALVGAEAADRLQEASHGINAEADLIEILRGLDLSVDPDELVRLAASSSIDELRQELSIPLGQFNEALRLLGQPPIHYREEHQAALAAFIARKKETILARLRRAYYSLYRAGESLRGYATSRDAVSAIAPDPAWLDEYEVPPDALMEAIVRSWLDTQTEGLAESSVRLRPIEAIQRENRTRLHGLLEQAQRLITAWSEKRGSPVLDAWKDAELERRLWDRLLEAGRTDFEPLTEDDLIKWIAEQELWAVDMPHSLDPVILGLTQEDLIRAKSEEEVEHARREFVKRSIEIGGARHPADVDNYAALAAVALASVTDRFLKARPGFTRMKEIPEVRRSARRSGTRVKAANRPANETQRGAIGLVGEVLALEWLKRRYSSATDDAWRSGYRDFVLGGNRGDDSLGYDFEVPSGNTILFFEVKSTVGDDTEIELAESEVLAARRHARGTRYRILYIPHVLDEARRSIYVLPNPVSERSRDFYRPSGAGLKYRFLLEGK